MWFFRRKNKSTREALKLGELLKEYGWRVEYEKWDGHKHIDIAIPEARVDIEVDGHQHNFNPHQALMDLERTYYSFRRGYLTLRIPNALIRDHYITRTTAEFINRFLRASERDLHA